MCCPVLTFRTAVPGVGSTGSRLKGVPEKPGMSCAMRLGTAWYWRCYAATPRLVLRHRTRMYQELAESLQAMDEVVPASLRSYASATESPALTRELPVPGDTKVRDRVEQDSTRVCGGRRSSGTTRLSSYVSSTGRHLYWHAVYCSGTRGTNEWHAGTRSGSMSCAGSTTAGALRYAPTGGLRTAQY